MKKALSDRNLLDRIALPPAVDALLTALQPDAPVPAGNDVTGTVEFGVDEHPLGFLSLNLKPPGPNVPYHLVSDANSFKLWLVLSKTPPAKKIFSFAKGAVGTVLKPATVQTDGRLEWLEAAAGDVSLTGVEVTILIEGQAGGTASMRLSPTDGQPAGIIRLGLDPPSVLLGGSGFGLQLPQAVWLDDSDVASPQGQTVVDGRTLQTAADQPPWRGLAVREARFFLPRETPLFGGHAVDAFVEVGSSPSGIDLAIATRWKPPPGGDGIGFDVLIECRDPSASGLQDFVPTLVEATMTLPIEETKPPQVDGKGFSMLAGKPVVVRLRFARSSSDPQTRVTLGLESQGPNGIVTVKAPEGGAAARAFIGAGALATALVADDPPASADATGVGLYGVLVLGLGVSAFLKNQGRVTLNAVELESTGHGVPVGDTLELRLDYSVDVIVQPITVGALSVAMADEQPMRVRNRNVHLVYKPNESGLDKFHLDFSAADMEIEDPGLWRVHGPDSLFDILGTRSGRGSTWLEIDLRFKLNLGPVKISGATIRGTLEDNGKVTASLRGLDASIAVPGAIEGEGKLQLLEGGGFEAEMAASLVPLNLDAGATVLYQPHGNSFMFFLKIGVDLPGPIPVANTGLGIYGVAGAFGVNAKPTSPGPHEDPIAFQLAWDSSKPLTAFTYGPDDLTIGAEAVIGTVPDLGFSFSAKGGLFLTIPDLVIRGSLWGKVLSPRLKVIDHPSGTDIGLSFKGVVVVDENDGVTIGLKGELNIPVLLEVVVPLGAHFPFSHPGVDSSDWFINLGADGYVNPSRQDGRALGPIRATVLPDLMPVDADAYFMTRGKGIDNWPRGGAVSFPDGFLLCFGFGFEYVIGVKGVVWAEVHASLDVLLATRPLTLAGYGAVGGSLNLGPLSIGVDAHISFLVAEHADPYIYAQVCGHIDLLFTEIEGCVDISIHDPPTYDVPVIDVHPLDDIQNEAVVGDLAFLIDDRYRRLGKLSRTHANLKPVWPDTLLHLSFAESPTLAAGYTGGQFAGIDSYPTGLAAKPIGSKMLHYEWTLTSLELFDVTNDLNGPGTPVPGPLSAAWQLGKDGDPGARPQAGDLVLLTYQGDLWLNRLTDAGANLPYDPVEETANFCQGDVRAQLGWAVGWGSTTAQSRFVMLSDPQSADPTVSTFTATVTLGWSGMPGVVFGPLAARSLPSPFQYDAPALEPSVPPLKEEREFDGVLDLGGVFGPSRDERVGGASTALMEPSDTLQEARLWLLADGYGERDLVVRDDRGEVWDFQPFPVLFGRVPIRFTPPSGGPIKSLTVSWMGGNRVGVLGLGGITDAAQRAAEARQDARAAESARQNAAATKQPQDETTKTGAGSRCVLDPGKTYRLDVDMTWSGWLEVQQEDGSTKEYTKLDQTTYNPKGGPSGTPTKRSFFFRTTPKPDPKKKLPTAKILYGQQGYITLLHHKVDVFDPQMLQRHVAGFTPAQSEQDRFRNDPLQVHFSASHIATLAKEYGYDLKLGLRRVDAAGADGEEKILNPALIAIQDASVLGKLDQRRFSAAEIGPCAVPKPGATAQAIEPLAPQAWYEVYVLAQGSGDVADGRLPGVTFKTSRWLTPADMLEALGFTAPAGKATGELPLATVPALPVELDQDAGFQAAVDALGLDGWPLADEPRLSLLWVRPQPGQPWLCAGLLVESPEAIHRPGRCELQGLALQPAQAGISFQLVRSDRTRSRLLFLVSQPFEPAAGSELVLTLVDKTGGSPSGAIELPPQPELAAEP